MFLLVITNKEIALDSQGQSYEINKYKINSSIVTIVTDNFLSKFMVGDTGFSLVESPFFSHEEYTDIILSQVTYDKENNSMEILRSTISGRPIYYHVDSKGNFFCSTHISMLRNAGVIIEENTDVLPEFFCFGYIMPPSTLYKNIKQLPEGGQLSIKLVNGKCEIFHLENYIPPIPDEKVAGPIDSISNCTRILLNETIQALKPSKDRISVLLSGGLDSSILFKMCNNNFGIDTTYSTGYPFEDPNSNDEKTYALTAAESFQTKHIYYEFTNEEYLRGVIEGISAAEEPLPVLQSVLLYILFKKGIPQNKNIVISGVGAEEIWGMPLQNTLYRNNKILFKFLSKEPQIILLKIISKITGRGEKLLESLMFTNTKKSCVISDPCHIIWCMENLGDVDWICKYFGITGPDIIKDRYNTIKQFEKRSIYDLYSIVEFFGFTSNTKSNWAKLGESQDKIVYYPFHHYKLLNYGYSIPWELKVKKPKNILRAVARQCKIPEFIITRYKRGMAISEKKWAEKGQIFEPLVPLAKKVFDEKQIRDVQSSDPRKAAIYWNILNYSIWKRLCINNEPVEILLDELNKELSEVRMKNENIRKMQKPDG